MPCPGRFTPGKDLVPIVQEAGWAPGPVWTCAENLAPLPGKDKGNEKTNSDFYEICSKINNIQYTAQINISKHY